MARAARIARGARWSAEERRTRITEWRARTSLAVDAGAVTTLLRAHDPLDVLSKWTLIRGQLEPRVWA